MHSIDHHCFLQISHWPLLRFLYLWPLRHWETIVVQNGIQFAFGHYCETMNKISLSVEANCNDVEMTMRSDVEARQWTRQTMSHRVTSLEPEHDDNDIPMYYNRCFFCLLEIMIWAMCKLDTHSLQFLKPSNTNVGSHIHYVLSKASLWITWNMILYGGCGR